MNRQTLEREFANLVERDLSLNLTRGKPGTAQVALSDALDGILDGNFMCSDGADARNYGGLRGIPECCELGSNLTDYPAELIIAAGNSSLQLMYFVLETIVNYGLAGSVALREKPCKAICPVPGYDRHFAATEFLGVEMVCVDLNDDGPDMDQVEDLVLNDPSTSIMWCVPKHSNPTGCTYSETVVRRIANLPRLRSDAHESPFFVLWDNAYSAHDFGTEPVALSSIFDHAVAAETLDRIVAFASTSKITHAGAGVAFLASGNRVLSDLEARLSVMIIGFDKVNQLRHARFLPDRKRLADHMQKHAEIVRPLFEATEKGLQEQLGNTGLATWTQPTGGYFVSLDVPNGLAKEVVTLAGSAGLQLTAAGATFPYGNDPNDANIRIAPTFASVEEVEAAMTIVGMSVRLAAARR